MAEDEEELTTEDEVANLDATISALIDVLVEKRVMTTKEFEDKLKTYYDEE